MTLPKFKLRFKPYKSIVKFCQITSSEQKQQINLPHFFEHLLHNASPTLSLKINPRVRRVLSLFNYQLTFSGYFADLWFLLTY